MYLPKNKKEEDYVFHLRTGFIKVTSTRLELMRLFSSAQKPLSLRDICISIRNHDQSTLQRAIDKLVSAKLIKVITFDPKKSLYETNINRPHHHHIICTICGFLENINFFAHKKTCALLPTAKIPKSFVSISDHSLEFFGICAKCVS